MSNFTDVFHALDRDNKGYILFDDFKNEMVKYLFIDEQSWSSDENSDQKKAIDQFLNSLSQNNGNKIYLNDFVEALKELSNSNSIIIDTNEINNEYENNKSQQFFDNNDINPFINDVDNYSTGDSGFENQPRVNRDYFINDIGKQNRKRIKAFQNPDLLQSGETLKRRFSENEFVNSDDTNLPDNKLYQKSYYNLPQTGLKNSYNCERRKRNYASSDFVTCASNRINRYSGYEIEDEAKSLHYWTPHSGSVTDLYYHDSMNDIRQKLEKLEQSMDNLQITTADSKISKSRWMDDNQNLKSKIDKLEDIIKSQKMQFELNMNNEIENSRKLMNKYEKSKIEEIDILNERLKNKDNELDKLRKELNIALGECERMKYDKKRTEDKLEDLQQQMCAIEEDMRRLKDFHSRELEILSKERNRLLSRMKSSESDQNSENISLQTNIISPQLLKEISKLRLENQDLKSKLETCEEEFLALSIQHGQNILQTLSTDDSWMAEIDGYTKSEVIDLLVKEKDANIRLREYVSNILTRVIDKDPSLLEIT